MQLTPEQQAVVQHPPQRHARVLAGPGTGKSSTVISLANKLQSDGVNGVRLVTFTRAASGELAAKVLAEGTEELTPSTIHSFAISVLLSNLGSTGMPEPLRLLDEWEWKELVRPLFCRQLALRGQDWRLVDEFRREMAAKWESLSDQESPKITGSLRARFMGAWDDQRALLGYALVAEIPYRLHEALLSHPDLDLGGLSLLIVDEYQDLNACDLACLDQLSRRGVTLIAVGDDDQSIYGFRKAHPAGIREFIAKYGASDYQLTINHRCGRNILAWADSVIQRDLQRGAKVAVTPGINNKAGEVAYLEFAGEVSEARGVARAIRALHDMRGVPFNEILVLTRTENVGAPIGAELAAQGIPFRYSDALTDMLDQDDVRETLAFLRIAGSPQDSVAWWTLLHLASGVGVSAIDALANSARQARVPFGAHLLFLHANGTLKQIVGVRGDTKIRTTLGRLAQLSLPQQGPWGAWIRDEARASHLPPLPEAFLDLLSQIDGIVEPSLTLDRYLGQLRPMTKDLAMTLKADAVRVMTMASSKGLTAQACIIAGCEDNIIPHPLGLREEELRLLYVAMTRAQEFLFITRARSRRGQTARVGRASVRNLRTTCPFLEGGPVVQQDGNSFLDNFS